MKSKIILSLIMTMSLSFTTLPAYALNSNVVSSAPMQSIVNNKIKFEVVNTEDAPQALMEMINKRKEEKGFIYTIDDSSGYTYIAVMNGEKPTGGYSIEVTGIEDNEGRTNVLVNELAPAKDIFVTQVITYPYTIVRAKGITPNITVKNLKNEYFSNLTMKKIEHPVGVNSITGTLSKIETIGKNIYITILDGKGSYQSYYSSNLKIINDLKVGDNVLVKYVLGTPAKYKDTMAMPFSNISINTFVSKIKNKDWKDLKNYVNVSENKEWTIKFNKSINDLNLNNDTIYLLDSFGNKVNVDLSVSYDKKYAKVTPTSNYELAKTYYLFISNSIFGEEKNKSSIEGYRMMFTIRDAVEVE
ncbi:protease complex subunit PrcB family protein [Clostridium sp. CS001]|uniref:protease complex subunit PrcB family protein n=1 Tax=Clostridium sp. CS001 TaxID=2880648 RepID=UPI001CF54505|nr:protease complex subunit PrcB family protein [Clostridium sp. CS001]MCB2288622.1 protease complex subunit PrcB family protein [Clostridium sp. CS001]